MEKDQILDPEIFRFINDMNQKEKERKKLYGEVKPIIQAEQKGIRVIAIGNKVIASNKWRTFPDFLFDYLVVVFGKDWFNIEKSKPKAYQHPVMQWRYSISNFEKHQKPNDKGFYDAIPSGPLKAYITLAYDLYILQHHMKLQDSIINRLKKNDQFQGARYELFVASTMIRAGYKINYDLILKRGKKLVEFIAKHIDSGEEIAIEAKSRHRSGVLGQKGRKESPESIRIRLGKLINSAISKKPSLPYFIFVDMNLPPEKISDFEGANINEMVKSLSTAPKAEKDKDYYNLILYTNFPYHYGDDLENYPKDHLSAAISLNPLYPLKNNNLIRDIQIIIKRYGRIPNSFQ